MSNYESARVAYLPSAGNLVRRSGDSVRRLLDATIELLHESRYPDVTMRSIAQRAGVADITAYTYFPSKNALIAEVYLRSLREVPLVVDVDHSVPVRVITQFRRLARVLADEPAVAAACSIALMCNEPSVRVVQEKIGKEVHRQISAAMGSGAWPEVVDALEIGFYGALVRAGSGVPGYRHVADQLESLVAQILGGAIAPRSTRRIDGNSTDGS
jgi:AcrR family transcriptional regulator